MFDFRFFTLNVDSSVLGSLNNKLYSVSAILIFDLVAVV